LATADNITCNFRYPSCSSIAAPAAGEPRDSLRAAPHKSQRRRKLMRYEALPLAEAQCGELLLGYHTARLHTLATPQPTTEFFSAFCCFFSPHDPPSTSPTGTSLVLVLTAGLLPPSMRAKELLFLLCLPLTYPRRHLYQPITYLTEKYTTRYCSTAPLLLSRLINHLNRLPVALISNPSYSSAKQLFAKQLTVLWYFKVRYQYSNIAYTQCLR
jgi:hypothetical protein